MFVRRTLIRAFLAGAFVALAAPASAQDQPNFLIIWGDDVGYWNISFNSHGMMGFDTPNIDRIAREGMSFTDFYAEQSCTAGRAAFMTGQSPVRTGLTKVGMPGAELGLQPEDPTIAELLQPLGYTTGQFGKNHLGDLDEHLPTNHGFDEFFGNLYHLNAEEEPENPDYPTEEQFPGFREQFGPRGVIHSYADGRIEDTGPLTKQRMETIDEEFLAAADRFIRDANSRNQPFFVWFAATRMHVWTHLKPESEGVTGLGVYSDGMVEHDGHVGRLLDLLDELGIADNTFVMYSTDNGAEVFTWPDGGTIPWRGEKNTTWEGGFRVPTFVRWPGNIPAGSISNDIVSHQDWLPTFLAMAGVPDVKEQLLTGYEAGGKTFRVHIDGYNQLAHLTSGGETATPRREFFYFTDDGSLSAMRWNNWKVMFTEQRAHGAEVWADPLVPLRFPKIYNLRSDPFERAEQEGIGYEKWWFDRMFALVPAQSIVREFLMTFVDYPPRQTPSSFSIDQVLQQMEQARRATGR